MHNRKIMRGLVSVVVLMTIIISFGTIESHSQKIDSNKQNNKDSKDLSKYAVVNYDAPMFSNAVERQDRELKSSRYDNQHLVAKNPHPETGETDVFDEISPPPVIPIAESNLVIVGEIKNVIAYLSNDKKGVYSEYAIRVEEIFKDDNSEKLTSKSSVTADRMGGFVKYSNGQKVLYKIAGQDLPQVGSRYVLFLTDDKKSPNFSILTGYELKEGKVNPLDSSINFNDFLGISDLNFIKAVRNKISESSFSGWYFNYQQNFTGFQKPLFSITRVL